MVSSVAEGEDKPLKYPLMFRACELVVVNKIDLLPHVDFDLDRFLHHLDAVHPGVDACWSARARARASRRSATGWRAAREAPADAALGRRAARRSRARAATSGSSTPRPSGSRGSATRWPSASRAAAG